MKKWFKEVSLKEILGTEQFPTVFPYAVSGDGNCFLLDYVLLSGLAKQFKDCNYLEIGTWRGESICNVARYAKHCISISHSPEMWVEFGAGHSVESLNSLFMVNEKNNIEAIGADTFEFDFNTLEQKFDLIFIDAEHSYECTLINTQKIWPLLRDENSIIVWHSYVVPDANFDPAKPSLLAGNTVDIMNAIKDGIPAEMHRYLYGVENTWCAVFCRKELSSHEVLPWEKKAKVYELKLKETVLPY